MARNAPLTYDARTGLWQLHEDVEVLGFRIPDGFEFDLASIPRFLWPVIAPFELSIEAPLLHDWLYRGSSTLTRAEADAMFYTAMKDEGVSWWRRAVAWLAVRAAGGVFWGGR